MKTGVIIAAVILIARIALEQAGAPESVNSIFGVVWLYLVLPVFFAVHLTKASVASPFKAVIKDSALFGLYTRLMIMVIYMVAYELRWTSPRFMLNQGGNIGPDVSFLVGFIFIPVRNVFIWVVVAVVAGTITGGATLLLRKRTAVPA